MRWVQQYTRRVRDVERRLAAINRRPRLWLTIFALLLAIQISPFWHPTKDGAVYLSVARSLSNGGQLTQLGSPCYTIPLGYPALISPAFLAGDRPFLAISVIQWMLAVACLLGVYYWARRHFPSVAVQITGLAMLNAAVWFHYRQTLKEIAFMAVLIWTVNVLHALLRPLPARRLLPYAFVATALATVLALIRYPGILILTGFGAAMVWQAYRRRITWVRAVVLTLAVAIPPSAALCGYLHHTRTLARQYSSSTYADGFQESSSGWGDRLLEGLRIRISETGRVTIPCMFKSYARAGEWGNPNTIVYVAWFGVIVIGWWHLAFRRRDIWALSFPFYFGLYVTWPCDQGARFMTPMVPLLMMCVVVGMTRSVFRRVHMPGIFLLAHLAAAAAYWAVVDMPRTIACNRHWPAIDRLAATIRTDPGTVAISDSLHREEVMLELAIDRPVRRLRPRQPVEESVDWLILSQKASANGQFVLRDTVGDYRLLSRSRPPALANGAGQSPNR